MRMNLTSELPESDYFGNAIVVAPDGTLRSIANTLIHGRLVLTYRLVLTNPDLKYCQQGSALIESQSTTNDNSSHPIR